MRCKRYLLPSMGYPCIIEPSTWPIFPIKPPGFSSHFHAFQLCSSRPVRSNFCSYNLNKSFMLRSYACHICAVSYMQRNRKRHRNSGFTIEVLWMRKEACHRQTPDQPTTIDEWLWFFLTRSLLLRSRILPRTRFRFLKTFLQKDTGCGNPRPVSPILAKAAVGLCLPNLFIKMQQNIHFIFLKLPYFRSILITTQGKSPPHQRVYNRGA